MLNKVQENIDEQIKEKQLMAQVKQKTQSKSEAKSDPIAGSLGHPPKKTPPPNEDARLEAYLRSLKPQKYIVDPDEHPET